MYIPIYLLQRAAGADDQNRHCVFFDMYGGSAVLHEQDAEATIGSMPSQSEGELSGTHESVCLQACAGVEESGVADEATWRALLGDKYNPAVPPVDVSVSHPGSR